MNAYFGDKRIALEPIPNDATAVVVRVETWEKMESALTTLRAELDAKTAELDRLRTVLKQIYLQHPETTLALMMAVGISEP